jgi:hypothetical protein
MSCSDGRDWYVCDLFIPVFFSQPIVEVGFVHILVSIPSPSPACWVCEVEEADGRAVGDVNERAEVVGMARLLSR